MRHITRFISRLVLRGLPRAAVGVSLVFLLAAGMLSGCGGKEYQDGDARPVKGVFTGTVHDVTEIKVENKPALQISIDLDNGRTLVVVQGYDDYFVKGDRVRVLNLGDGRARVQMQ